MNPFIVHSEGKGATYVNLNKWIRVGDTKTDRIIAFFENRTRGECVLLNYDDRIISSKATPMDISISVVAVPGNSTKIVYFAMFEPGSDPTQSDFEVDLIRIGFLGSQCGLLLEQHIYESKEPAGSINLINFKDTQGTRRIKYRAQASCLYTGETHFANWIFSVYNYDSVVVSVYKESLLLIVSAVGGALGMAVYLFAFCFGTQLRLHSATVPSATGDNSSQPVIQRVSKFKFDFLLNWYYGNTWRRQNSVTPVHVSEDVEPPASYFDRKTPSLSTLEVQEHGNGSSV